jgi:hypothetical protein
MTQDLLNWVSLLPEVGSPIRDAAQTIDEMRQQAADILAWADKHEIALLARIGVNWTETDICVAKLNAKSLADA